jgi:hypothetical protein
VVCPRCVVEARVAEQVLGTVRAALEPVGAIPELHVVLADVLQASPFQEAARSRIALGDRECAGSSIEARRATGSRAQIDGDVRALSEGRLVGPGAP